MNLAITGHRELNGSYDINSGAFQNLKPQIIKLINKYKPDKLLQGGAIGVDYLFYTIGVELNLPIKVFIPFVGQELRWPWSQQKLYWEMLENPLVEKTICNAGTTWDQKIKAFQIRNEKMVDECDILIGIYDKRPKSGTKNCINYAKKINKTVKIIDPRKYYNI